MRDVGIVGAGPAGLLAANVLVRAGIDCVVFERLAEDAVRARARAGQIEYRTVRLLDRHGLADGLLTRGKTMGTCEFRRAGRRHVFDYAALSGAAHHSYPQQLLVGDLVDSLRAAGGQICFGVAVESIRLGDEPVIVTGDEEVRCGFVLGCDGFHGVARAAARGTRACGVDFGARWLAILAEAPPSGVEQLYGLHPEGFAGQMHRTSAVSRFYLQIPPGADAGTWDTDAIWSHLDTRLAADGESLVRGPVIGTSVLELHSYVTEPMQAGRLFLAGDAAHIVTPAGGKGMNLALQDAAELAEGLLAHFRSGDPGRLSAYSSTRLPRIWQTVEFSHWMLHLLLADPSGGAFHEGLREARLARLMSDELFARAFALAYVGTDTCGVPG
jgi:p-hydroxybenzoate 3-monooxygenase